VHAVALEIMVRAGGFIDRDFMEIRPAEAADLRIGIGEESALQQRIVAEVYPRNDMPWMEAACSFSAKKLSGLRLRTILPTRCTGTSASGISLVGSSRSKSKANSSSSGISCKPSSYSG
jgi:hypothetical protein